MNMNEINRRPSVEVLNRPKTSYIDEGLRQYMIKVFNYMGAGLCVTALVAYLVANTGLIQFLYKINPQTQSASLSFLGWIVTLSPLAMIFAFQYVLSHKSLATSQLMFWGFSALMGASLANIFLIYTAASMTRVFLISAATFGVMSLYGYTTKRDLSKIGSFLFMGLIGLILASVVNIFLQSPALYYALSYIGVAIFVGLTAWDIQKVKSIYYDSDTQDIASRKAISGALSLYLDFVNLFLNLLSILGDRR